MGLFGKNNDKQDLLIELVGAVAEKVEKLDSRLDSVDKTLIKQELNLQEHMKRTEINEKSLEKLKEQVDLQNELIRKRIELEDRIILLGKVVLFISAAIFGIAKFIQILNSMGILG